MYAGFGDEEWYGQEGKGPRIPPDPWKESYGCVDWAEKSKSVAREYVEVGT